MGHTEDAQDRPAPFQADTPPDEAPNALAAAHVHAAAMVAIGEEGRRRPVFDATCGDSRCSPRRDRVERAPTVNHTTEG